MTPPINSKMALAAVIAKAYNTTASLREVCDVAYNTHPEIERSELMFESMWLAINAYSFTYGNGTTKKADSPHDLSILKQIASAIAAAYETEEALIYATHKASDALKNANVRPKHLSEMWFAIDENIGC